MMNVIIYYLEEKKTKGKNDLYQDLEPKTLKLMYEEFKNFLSEFEYYYEPSKHMLENINKLYKNWFYTLIDEYIPSLSKIKCSMKIFMC